MPNISASSDEVKTPSHEPSFTTTDAAERLRLLHGAPVRRHRAIYERFGPTIDDIVVAAAAAETPKNDQRNRSTLIGLYAYAHERGWPTNPRRLLVGQFIDEYCNTVAPGSAAMFRTRLDRLSDAIGNSQPGVARRRFPRHHIRTPHTAAEKAGFYLAARRLPEKNGRRRDALMMLDLTFGAGCSATSVYNATESWVVPEGTGAWLLDPERDQPIWLPKPIARRVLSRLTGDGDRHLVKPDGTESTRETARVIERMRAWSPSLQNFAAARAKSRWRVDVLEKTGFGVIAQLLAGQPEHRTLLDLMHFIAPVSETDAKAIARRAVKS